jgi:tRNA(Leu) C34 or U34 (ribose-2'-O)-methylase TrmL
MSVAVVLLNPKTPFNVGNALRACSVFGVTDLWWTGDRVLDPQDNRQVLRAAPQVTKRQARLPREERMKEYHRVRWGHDEGALDRLIADGCTPVCVEVMADAEQLPDFEHPDRAVYVFGPEDSGVSKGVRAVCHRFVTIPAAGCLNLAAAVNVVLYDRAAKLSARTTV